jgi:glycosyltransferase involved in cell wall biosynthesis
VVLEYRFRDIASQFLGRSISRLTRDTIEYVATGGLPFHIRRYVAWYLRHVGLSRRLEEPDGTCLVHGLSHFLPRFVRKARKVITVHDVGPMRMPHLYPAEYADYMRREFAMQLDVCDRIIVVSPFTGREVNKLYGIAWDKISVVPLGVERKFRREENPGILSRYGITGRYVFYPVGTVEPRKNIKAVIDGVREVRRRTRIPLILVLTGRRLVRYPKLESEISGALSDGMVLDLGFVPESHLLALYSGADATLYPSLYEGFGLPVLESMACGTPVVITDIEPLTYVADDAGFRATSASPDSISKSIETVITDENLRARLVSAGLRRVEDFQWNETARRTVQVYRELE